MHALSGLSASYNVHIRSLVCLYYTVYALWSNCILQLTLCGLFVSNNVHSGLYHTSYTLWSNCILQLTLCGLTVSYSVYTLYVLSVSYSVRSVVCLYHTAYAFWSVCIIQRTLSGLSVSYNVRSPVCLYHTAYTHSVVQLSVPRLSLIHI